MTLRQHVVYYLESPRPRGQIVLLFCCCQNCIYLFTYAFVVFLYILFINTSDNLTVEREKSSLVSKSYF